MPNRLSFALWASLLFLPFLSSAQNTNYQVTITGPSLVCYGTCAQYTAVFTSPGGSNPPLSSNITWYTSNGITVGTGTSVFMCFPPNGSGTLFVSALLANAQEVITDTLNITVLPNIPLSITSDNAAVCNQDSSSGPSNPDNQICQKVCPYSTVTYSLNPLISGAQQTVQWTVTGAQSYTVNPPNGSSVTVQWGGPGQGAVLVKADPASTSYYCTTEGYTCVTIIEAPEAAFSTEPESDSPPAPVQVCKGQTMYFNNLSTNADAFEWYFGDGSQPSAAFEPEHTYLNPGIYDVTLIARSACLCSDTIVQQIEVLDAEAPLLDCVGTLCAGETATYTTAAGCANYVWTVSGNGSVLGGGSSVDNSVTVQWNDGPSGTITLFTPACGPSACPFPAVIRVPVLSDNAEIGGAEIVCPGDENVYAIEPFGGTNFVWTLSSGGTITSGQGTNRVTVQWYNYPNPNTTNWLSVVYDNCYLGCGGQDSIPVKIVSPFTISGPIERCEGANGVFTAKLVSPLQNINCDWTMTAPDGSIVWTATGIPSANVNFTNGPGRYRLVAQPSTPGQTCSDQVEWVVNVPASPTPLTGIDGPALICPGQPVTYMAEGASPLSNVNWIIQNGPGAPVTANGENLAITWGPAGPYWLAAQQVSTDGLNCISDTIRFDVSAVGSVSLSGATTVCVNSTASYSVPALDNVDYQWQISPADAGTIASGQGTSSVSIFWQNAGNHTVSIQVCGQTANFNVNVVALPVPQVTAPASLCSGQTATVQTVGAYNTYSWQNASGNELSALSSVVIGSGAYTIEVTDANGCVGSANFNIADAPPPNFTISTNDPTAFCNNSLFVTMNALTTADGDYQYEWFHNGTALGVNASSYTTNQYGSYTATATNQFGCSATAGPISIVPDCTGGGGGGGFPGGGFPPCQIGDVTLGITASPECDSFLLAASGTNYVAGSAQWTLFQSGAAIIGTTSGDNTSFAFPNAGEYVVILLAALQSGGVCKLIDSLDVEAVAAFNTLPECPGQPTGFQDISTFLPGSNITGWQWNFGDPGSGAANNSTVRNATHAYPAGGTYSATLTVTASSGCTSSTVETFDIEAGPSISFAQPAAACTGNASEFNAIAGADVTSIVWNFGDPGSGATNSAGGTPVFHDYATPGNYTVTATATNTYGCTTTFTQSITIVNNPLSGNINPAVPAPFCEGGSTTLTAPPGAVSYLWSDSTTVTQTLLVTEEGAYSVTMTDANGCTFSPPPVIVEQTPGPDAIIKALLTNDLGQVIGVSYPSLDACLGEDVSLQVFGSGNLSFQWSNGETNVLNVFTEIRNNLLSEGTHVFNLTVTDLSTGCTSVAQPFTVDVHPVPSGLTITANGYCAGSTTLTYTGPQPANWQINWNTGATGNTLSVEDGGNFFVQAVNEFGCVGQSNTISILPGPPDEAIPSGCHTRCNPDTLCLPPLPEVTGWQWFLNGAPIPGATGPDFVATQSGTYWAQLTDVYGCTAQSGDLVLDLYNGFGNILGQVWSDVNDNGMIDAADTLVPGIAVNLWQNGSTLANTQSNGSGDFVFPGVDAASYNVALDTAQLPPGWQVVIGQQAALIQGCDVQTNTDLLLSAFCTSAVFDTLQFNVCPGNTITYNNVTIAAGASQNFQFVTTGGCDSTLTVNVLPLATSAGTVNAQACPGDAFDYNGTLIPAGQSQQFTLTNYLGCDSIVTVNVATLPTSTGTVNAQACPGDAFDYNGTLIPAGQSQQFTLTNYLGCDSIVTVNVATLPLSTGTVNAQACPGDAFDYNGTLIPAGQSQQFTLTNYLGCDSIVTVNVATLPTSIGAINTLACPGEVFDFNGTLIPAGQSQQFVLTNIFGCDSIITVNVAALPVSTGTVNAQACPGDAFDYNGTLIPAGQSQQFMLTNYLGCDSIVTVNVGLASPSSFTLNAGACAGESYDYNGTLIPAGQSQQFTFTNYLGCDSVVTVNVATWPVSMGSFSAQICAGESFDFNGTPILAGTSAQITLTNYLGCDSILTITVGALPEYSSTLDVSLCPGEVFDYAGIPIPANQTVEVILQSQLGCDSTVTITTTALPETGFALAATNSCPDTTSGSLSAVGVNGGTPPFLYSLDGATFQSEPDFSGLAAGAYTLFVQDANGCVAQRDTVLDAYEPLQVVLSDGILACDSTAVLLEPQVLGDSVAVSFAWSNGDTTSSVLLTETGPVWVSVSNRCETVLASAEVKWADVGAAKLYYVPNVVAPAAVNPDNALFKAFFPQGVVVNNFIFRVYDRWGNWMWDSPGPDEGWLSLFRSRDMQPGVYVWYLEATVDYCGRTIVIRDKGDVTIVR